jgi:hypothetical protein
MKKAKVTLKTAGRWAGRAWAGGQNVADLPRKGRPLKLSAPDVKALKRSVKHGATATLALTRRITRGMVAVALTTCTRALGRGKVPLIRSKKVQVRRLSLVNMIKRVIFCKAQGLLPPATIDAWVYLDGTVITLYMQRDGKGVYAWHRRGDPPTKTKGKLVAYFFVYAAVAKGWRSQLFFAPPSANPYTKEVKSKEEFKGKHFVEFMGVLKQQLVAHFGSSLPIHIIRDRAPQHTSKATTEALSTLNLPIVEDFPPQSFDINCIELVWGQLKQKVEARRPVTSRGLYDVIRRAWDEISISTIDGIVAGVPKRMMRIVENEGRWLGKYIDRV